MVVSRILLAFMAQYTLACVTKAALYSFRSEPLGPRFRTSFMTAMQGALFDQESGRGPSPSPVQFWNRPVKDFANMF
jgi:hypothetical protein